MRLLLLLVVVAVSLIPCTSQARGPWQRRAILRGRYYQQKVAPPSFHESRSAAYWRSQYPQYYGGFHARHLQNIGIPTGDIGIRGNSITVNPW